MKNLLLLTISFLAFTALGKEFDQSNDGKYTACYSSFNNVVYVIDNGDSKVIKRLRCDIEHMGKRNIHVAFSQDDSKLWCTAYEHLISINTSDWTIISNEEDAKLVRFSVDGTKIIHRDGFGKTFKVLDMNTGEKLSSFEVFEPNKIKHFAISGKDNSAVILYRAESSDYEEYRPDQSKLDQLEGVKKAMEYQKNDGEKMRIIKYALDGKELYNGYTYFSNLSNPSFFAFDGNYYLLNMYGSFKLDAKNKLTVLDLPSGTFMKSMAYSKGLVPIKFYKKSGIYDLNKGKFQEVEFDRKLETEDAILLKDKIISFTNLELIYWDLEGKKISTVRVY